MKRRIRLVPLVAAVSVGASLMAAPARAGDAGAVIAGAIGGVTLGAIIGGALSQPHYGATVYYPSYGYGTPAYSYRPERIETYAAPVQYRPCYPVRQPVYDEDGDFEGYSYARRCRW